MTGVAAAEFNSKKLEHLLTRMSGKDEAAFERLYAVTKRKIFLTVLLIVAIAG